MLRILCPRYQHSATKRDGYDPYGRQRYSGCQHYYPAGEFIEQSSSGVNSCCPERFLLWEKAEEYKKECAQRAGVEGTISQAVGAFGLRRARYCGQPKTHLQHVLVDAAPPMGRGHCPLSSLELRRPLFDKGLGGLPKILRQVQPQAAGVIGALLFHAAGEPA